MVEILKSQQIPPAAGSFRQIGTDIGISLVVGFPADVVYLPHQQNPADFLFRDKAVMPGDVFGIVREHFRFDGLCQKLCNLRGDLQQMFLQFCLRIGGEDHEPGFILVAVLPQQRFPHQKFQFIFHVGKGNPHFQCQFLRSGWRTVSGQQDVFVQLVGDDVPGALVGGIAAHGEIDVFRGITQFSVCSCHIDTFFQIIPALVQSGFYRTFRDGKLRGDLPDGFVFQIVRHQHLPPVGTDVGQCTPQGSQILFQNQLFFRGRGGVRNIILGKSTVLLHGEGKCALPPVDPLRSIPGIPVFRNAPYPAVGVLRYSPPGQGCQNRFRNVGHQFRRFIFIVCTGHGKVEQRLQHGFGKACGGEGEYICWCSHRFRLLSGV